MEPFLAFVGVVITATSAVMVQLLRNHRQINKVYDTVNTVESEIHDDTPSTLGQRVQRMERAQADHARYESAQLELIVETTQSHGSELRNHITQDERRFAEILEILKSREHHQ